MKKFSIIFISLLMMTAVFATITVHASAHQTAAGAQSVAMASETQAPLSVAESEPAQRVDTSLYTATLSKTKFDFTGKAIKPTVSVLDEQGKELSSEHYTLIYESAPGTVGKHSVKIKFLAPYYGSKTRYYTVKAKVSKDTVLNLSQKSTVSVYAYNQATKKDVSYNSVTKFTSSNPKVASISASGTVTALAAGKTTITTDTNGFVYTYELTVKAPVIYVNGSVQKAKTAKNGVAPGEAFFYIELAYQGGEYETKYFFGQKLLADKQQLKYSAYSFQSSDTSIVKVTSDGYIKAGSKAGTAVITVGAKYGATTYTKKVYVVLKYNKNVPPYYYNQKNYYDVVYDNPSTSGTESIASSGCGVCSAAMVVNSMAGKQLCTIPSLARFSVACGARDSSGTNIYTLLSAICKANTHFSYKATGDKQALLNHLKSGKMAIINQGDAYSVFSNAGHFVVAYKAVGDSVEIFDPLVYSGKYTSGVKATRIISATSRGCIVSIDQVVKATCDRNPGYFLIYYSASGSQVAPLDAQNKSQTKNYANSFTMYCSTNGGLRFRKSASTSAGLVQGANGGASIIGYRDAVEVLGSVSNGQGKWYKIRYRGYVGYASANYLVSSRPGAKTITIPKGRNLRAAIGTSAKVLAVTKKAYKAELLVDSYWRASGYAWSRIKIGGKTYYYAMT